MKASRQFGLQSFCLRHFKDNAVVAAKVRGLGLDRIELCRIHAELDVVDSVREAARNYADAGIAIVSLGVQVFHGESGEKGVFESAAAIGAKHISAALRVDSYLRAIPRLREWSREFGVRVGLHCHGGASFGGQPEVLTYLIGLGQPEVGLCLDTAWAMQIGPQKGNPVAWARQFAGAITAVHYKDFVFGADASWKDVPVGSGTLDLPAFVQALDEGGFDGVAILEYEAEPENPEPMLRECVARMRTALEQPENS